MDSITHLFLGGAIAAAMVPAKHRRMALLAGAVLNTLPDLDVLPLALVEDPVAVLTWHRGITHSLFVLPFVALALWYLLRDRVALFRDSPARGFWVILACLLAHPLIDAFTVYGTQLLWPLPVAPAMWSSLFIIDPLFTLILVLACVAAWVGRERAVVFGLVLAGAYVGWSQVAKWQVDRVASSSLAAMGLQDAPRVVTPMPFNTLLWRVVVLTPDGFLEGERSLVADRGPMSFSAYRSDEASLRAVSAYEPVVRLKWFSHGFLKAEQRDGRLVLSDLRMGAEPDYSFRFEVAEAHGGAWRPVPVKQLRWPWAAARRLPDVWKRIWIAPVSAH